MTPAVWPTFDVAEIAQEASERAGVEFRSGYALRKARRCLELLSIEWANRGYNLWTVEGPVSVPLIQGVVEYSLPDDTVDLIDHIIRTPGSAPGQFTDLPMDRMTLPEYDAMPNKQAQGRPTLIHVRRAVSPYFLIWMAPPLSPAYTLLYWRLRRMAPLGSGGTGVPEIPWRFVGAMTAGLAYYLALGSTDEAVVPRVGMLKDAYDEQFAFASDEDRDRAAFRFQPMDYSRLL